MQTVNGRRGFSGYPVRFGIAAVALVFSASVFAGPTKDHPLSPNRATTRNVVRKSCLVQFSGSAFPQPCERLGPLPSTTIPMDIIGEYPVRRRSK